MLPGTCFIDTKHLSHLHFILPILKRKIKGPQSRILHAKARSSTRAPAYILRRSAPFLLALGFNAAIPAHSKVVGYPDLFPVL